MKVPATDLKKGDHIVGYPPSMVVERTYKHRSIIDKKIGIVVEFNTGGKTYYQPYNKVEVDWKKDE